MERFVALLRAVNVGGLKLPMAELKAMCDAVGLEQARTYIASGNVVFRSELTERQVKAALERELRAFAGKAVGVMVRTAEEMAGVAAANPFPDARPKQLLVLFLDQAPGPDALAGVRHQKGERLALGKREIYIDYGEGIGASKLSLPASKVGTGRNLNTVIRLAEIAAES
jgi:uncharacterized protein (DUF1697 family)